MTTFDPKRRLALKQAGLFGVGALATTSLIAATAKAARTPPQAEGPFYPVKDQPDKDADMTIVAGHTEAAKGTRVYLSGKVLDADTGKPVSGALVEFWQACDSGRYNHPRDTNTAKLDPHFQYWSQVKTDQSGSFSVKTIKPGAYPADSNWMRPPHIHVKVHRAGYPSLTTQIYFAGDPLNDTDLILQKLKPSDRKLVTIHFNLNGDDDQTSMSGTWTIYIAKFRHEMIDETTNVTPEID